MISSLLAAAFLLQDSQQYQDPPSKLEELRKFHKPDVKAMPMSVRLDAFEKRRQMLSHSIFQQIPWRNVGPTVQGGRVIDIDVPENHPNEIYIGFATGGLWRTVNEGQSWTPLFDNQSAFGIGDFDVHPDGQLIWLGSGEANSQRTSYSGTGVFKSTDGGKTWTNMGLHESHHIGRVVIDPKDKNTVYVAALGPLYSQGGDRGVYKTTDGGKTWNKILGVDERTGAIDIAVNPENPKILYACMYDRDRRAWNYLESGPGSGVYTSHDAGKTWSKIESLPSGVDMGRTALAIAPSDPDVVYAFMDNQGADGDTGTYDTFDPAGTWNLSRFMRLDAASAKQADAEKLGDFLGSLINKDDDPAGVAKKLVSGEMTLDQVKALILKKDPRALDKQMNDAEVWRTSDGGKTWSKTRPDLGSFGGYYWNEISVSPVNADEVYILGLLVLQSFDGGKSWRAIARPNHVDHHAYWIDPKNPDRQLNGNDGGIYVSYDHGESWSHWNNLPVGQFTTIAVDNKEPYHIYGGLQDNGTMKGTFSNSRFGASNSWEDIGGGDGSAIAVDPRGGGDIVYTASQFGSHSATNFLTGERWNARASVPRGEPTLRYNWISPILISPHHPDIVYLGSQRLHRSFNMGKDYKALSGDLTKNLPNGDVPHSTLTTIAESYFRFGAIYVGADDGSAKYTPDSGITWIDISTPAKDRWFTRIIASKHKDGRIYATQNGYRQDEWTPYVWASEDNGKTWTSIAANLPFEPVNTIREDPTDENILFVGTDMGVYVSTNRGKSWMTYGGGIPHTPVHDIAIQEREEEIVIASHARSVWVISTKPIHQLTDEIMKSDFHRFELDVPSGWERWTYRRPAEYENLNPQDISIQMTLWSGQSGTGTLALVDKDGKVVKSVKDIAVVRGYNFLSLGLLLEKGDPTAPPNYGNRDQIKDVLSDAYQARRPKYVPVGDYKLVLSVGGKSHTEDITIK